ncbi:phosphotransferase [bacterium]|nr:phosphotransferase [bacterium]
MWKLFFETCNVLCCLVPGRDRRAHIRRLKLYDWRRKYNALRRAYPELNFNRTQMIKGGWNIGFIVDRRYVFKIRKFYDKTIPTEKIMREQRITNALADTASIRIPRIAVVRTGGYTFYKYDFIPGRNMNTYSSRTIAKYAPRWGAQIGEFIHSIHTARAPDIDDLRDRDGDGWNHNDICNNVIIDPKTMNVVGVIDWEYSGWGMLATEFENCVRFSKKINESGILTYIQKKYYELSSK